MKTNTRDCLYLQGVMALLDEMNLEYTGDGIWISEKNFIPFFIFPENNVFNTYKGVLKQRIRSPALVFCSSHMIPFLRDVYFSEALYFISLNETCEVVKKDIRNAIRRYQRKDQSDISDTCPYSLLSASEVDVVKYLMEGYTPSTISAVTDMPFRHISLYKRSAMRKLKVSTFHELYFKVKLLECYNESPILHSALVTNESGLSRYPP